MGPTTAGIVVEVKRACIAVFVRATTRLATHLQQATPAASYIGWLTSDHILKPNHILQSGCICGGETGMQRVFVRPVQVIPSPTTHGQPYA